MEIFEVPQIRSSFSNVHDQYWVGRCGSIDRAMNSRHVGPGLKAGKYFAGWKFILSN